MVKKKHKFIMKIFLFLIVFFLACPNISALTEEDSNILGLLKDGSTEVDFNYQLNLDETFSVMYNNFSISDVISSTADWSRLGMIIAPLYCEV